MMLSNSKGHYEQTNPSASKISSNLTIFGLLCSWVAWVVLSQAVGEFSKGDLIPPGGKPLIFYAMHGLGLFSVICAGLVSCISGKYGKLDFSGKASICVLSVTAILWAFAVYSVEDFLSFKALGATGPFVWLSCFCVFAGMEVKLWEKLDKVIKGMAYATSIIAIYDVMSTSGLVVERWFSGHVMNMVLLMWIGGWTLLSSSSKGEGKSPFCYIPFVVFVFLAVFTRTRSWLLISVALVFMLIINNSRSKITKNTPVLNKLIKSYIIFVLLIVCFFIFNDPLAKGFEGLVERGLEDTRSGQYTELFSQVSFAEFVVGRGPNGTWVFQGRDYQFFDNSYVWMMFIGGLPILVSYLLLIIRPGVKAFLRGAKAQDGAASILVCLWGIVCLGIGTYALPSITPYCFVIYLMTGRCYMFLNDNRN